MHIILIGYVTLDCTNPAFGPKTIGKSLRGPNLEGQKRKRLRPLPQSVP